MEPVESEEVMTVGGGCTAGLYIVPGVDRRSLAEITISVGTSLSIWKKQDRSGAERP